MKRWLLLLPLTLALTFCTNAVGARPDPYQPYPAHHPWIKLWTHRDHNLYEATRVAANIFRVSRSWLAACNRGEGGNTARTTLARTIHTGYGRGWNTQGSSAFGPWQYMLDSRPPYSSREWGTFGAYVHRAFVAAKRRGYAVPYRFKRPDSFVGQAITTAYMFKTGRSGHWTGGGC